MQTGCKIRLHAHNLSSTVQMSHIQALREVIDVLSLADKLSTTPLKNGIYKSASTTLSTLAAELAGHGGSSQESSIPDDSDLSSKASTKYHDFMVEITPAIRKAMPTGPQTERFKLAASLWTKYKHLVAVELILEAAKKDLPVSPPVYSVNIAA